MTIKVSAGLASHEINAVTELSFGGSTTGGTVAAGDCFIIKRDQPYAKSLLEWKKAGGTDATFYSPFGPITTPTLDAAASPAADVTKTNDFELKVTVKAGAVANAIFAYKVASIKNPYSAIQDVTIDIKHYPGCNTAGASTAPSTNVAISLGTQFVVSSSTMVQPTGAISAKTTGPNMVASRDGYFSVTMTPGEELPSYGGILVLTIPKWYVTATTTVFNVSPKTECSSPTVQGSTIAQQTSIGSNQHYFYFKEFTGTATTPITIKCSNYNNPIYDTAAVGPFAVKVQDLEEPPNDIVAYPSFTFDAVGLGARTALLPLAFQLFTGSSGTVSNPIAIQTSGSIAIEFEMGAVPVDDTGCYVKYTFPNDFVLPATALRSYQGSGIMATANKPPAEEYATLNVGSEVFIGN